MNKLGIAAGMVFAVTGTAAAQVRPGEPAAGQAAGFAVDGITLGSKLKLDSAMYREYKCSRSEQFDGFTWCQKSRRDSEKRGSFDLIYSILHAKDGTVVYINRYQHPAFFDANEADRDIQNYTRKFGGASPQVAKMPRRSGSADGVLATWGDIELVPLDADSMKVVAQGKSPRKGLLVDFIGDFPGSAKEGLPVFRISGGAGFVWSGTFDAKGKGALRFAAVNAAALQPGAAPSVALQSITPAATERAAPPPAEPAAPPPAARPIEQPPAAERVVTPPPKPAPQPSAVAPAAPPPMAAPVAPPPPAQVAQPPAVEPAAPSPAAKLAVRPPIPTQNVEQPPAASPAELAAAVKARRDTETTVARLQNELSAALQAKTEAEQARTQAETAARQARSDAEVARKEYEVARNEANAANGEIDRMMSGGMPASFIKGAIFIGISAAAVLFFIILAVAKILVWMSAKAEPELDQNELVDELAKSLGVEGPPPLLPSAPVEAQVDQDLIDIAQPAQTPVGANGDGRLISSQEPADGLVKEPAEAHSASKTPVNALTAEAGGPVLAPVAENGGDPPSPLRASTGLPAIALAETDGDVAKSIVPGIPNGGEATSEKSGDKATSEKSAHKELAPQPENANPS